VQWLGLVREKLRQEEAAAAPTKVGAGRVVVLAEAAMSLRWGVALMKETNFDKSGA
jgi:hypothetical protein